VNAPIFRPNTGFQPFRNRHIVSDPGSDWNLFFNPGTASTRESDPVAWSITQVVLEFVTATPNRFWMKARDLGDSLKTAMPQTHGLACCNPATLLLIQATQQQIQLVMIFTLGMLTRLTSRAATRVNHQFRGHCHTPSLGMTKRLH
jgi:hypothetical protein